jgi:heme/copper-type cytochrome/quinol oxidase subunit 2
MVKMVVIAALAALVATLVAVLIRWLPESASEEMDRITFVYWFATIICIGIFALVAAVIIEAVWAFACSPTTTPTGRRSTGTPGSRSPGRSSLRSS